MQSSPPPNNALDLVEIVQDGDKDPGLVLDRRDNLELDLSGFPIDSSPSLDLDPVILPRRLVSNPDHELRVGQTFCDASSCRRALRDAAIACNFEIQTVKSDKTRFTAKCTSHGCPWRVHAAKLPGQSTFSIRTIIATHTCEGITHPGHHQASVQWIASSVEQWLRENPHCKPKEILEEVQRVHGIRLSYKQAWRGKERVMALVHGSFEEEYKLLPKYCEEIKRTNPGSIASVYGHDDDGRFRRLFIAYHASIYGFVNGCRPVIGLDRVVLKNRYLGTLLLASGFDGEGALFPLAFGVVGEETDENWTWFLTELRLLLELNTANMLRLTILSDMRKGVVEGVNINFPSAFHGLCMRHLTESFQKEFKNNLLVGLLWEAAQALTVAEFDAKMMEINALSPQAAYWLNGIQYQLWATAHFKGSRFGLMTANVMESPSWILEAFNLPIIQMMECIRRQLMTWFSERREMSVPWSDLLVPLAFLHVSDLHQCAQEYQIMQANEVGLNVYSAREGITNTVDIRNRCCSCRGWQVYGLPCSHAVAALTSFGQNVYKFTENYFTVTTYRTAYSKTIHPIPDKNLWNVKDQLELVIKPPRSIIPLVKPRKRRARSHDGAPLKRVVHCSRCKQTGHFKSTCSAPV